MILHEEFLDLLKKSQYKYQYYKQVKKITNIYHKQFTQQMISTVAPITRVLIPFVSIFELQRLQKPLNKKMKTTYLLKSIPLYQHNPRLIGASRKKLDVYRNIFQNISNSQYMTYFLVMLNIFFSKYEIQIQDININQMINYCNKSLLLYTSEYILIARKHRINIITYNIMKIYFEHLNDYWVMDESISTVEHKYVGKKYVIYMQIPETLQAPKKIYKSFNYEPSEELILQKAHYKIERNIPYVIKNMKTLMKKCFLYGSQNKIPKDVICNIIWTFIINTELRFLRKEDYRSISKSFQQIQKHQMNK